MTIDENVDEIGCDVVEDPLIVRDEKNPDALVRDGVDALRNGLERIDIATKIAVRATMCRALLGHGRRRKGRCGHCWNSNSRSYRARSGRYGRH